MRSETVGASKLLALLEETGDRPASAIARARGGEEPGALAMERAVEEVASLAEQGVRVVGYFDEGFPARLRTIPSAPAVLYIRGELPADSQPALAVIGTREPSTFGRSAAEALTAAAAGAGTAIVSGLALGIDAIAHQVALDAGAKTVAILGSGLGNVSPHQNRGLAERIVAEGGALVSEQRHLAAPSPQSLVSRNRLQTGLSDALLVCQTGLRGGSLHTVRFAAEQGKPIWVAEPRSSSPSSEGNAALLGRAARDLPGILPAWRGRATLAERSGGGEPLGRPVKSSGIDRWMRELLAAEKTAGPADEQTLF